METTQQAVFVLKLLLALGPLAFYFLVLGLINSQARPCLVSARRDFILLAVAFIPVIAAPILAVIEHGGQRLVSGIVVGLLALFFGLLPRRDQSWVLYNCSPAQCRRLLQRSLARLGWQGRRTKEGILEIPRAGLRLTHTTLPWLRSVTLHTPPATTPEEQAMRHRLIKTLQEELSHEAMLPSATGISLVVIGAALLGLPMYYLFNNMDTIVNAVRLILSA